MGLLPSVDQLSISALKGIQPLQTFHQYHGPKFSSPTPAWDYTYSTPTNYAGKRVSVDFENAKRPWASVPCLKHAKLASLSMSISEEDEVELVDTILQLRSRLSQ